jgi:hypothetical protein
VPPQLRVARLRSRRGHSDIGHRDTPLPGPPRATGAINTVSISKQKKAAGPRGRAGRRASPVWGGGVEGRTGQVIHNVNVSLVYIFVAAPLVRPCCERHVLAPKPSVHGAAEGRRLSDSPLLAACRLQPGCRGPAAIQIYHLMRPVEAAVASPTLPIVAGTAVSRKWSAPSPSGAPNPGGEARIDSSRGANQSIITI